LPAAPCTVAVPTGAPVGVPSSLVPGTDAGAPGAGSAPLAEDAESLTIVIPAYDEAHRLATGFARLERAASLGAFDAADTRIIVVDDGSTDGTADLATDLLSAFPRTALVRLGTNQGKGAAIRAGVALVRSPVVAFTDADMAMDPAQLPALLDGLGESELSIADRTLPGARAEGPHLRRQLASWASNRVVRALTGLPYPDTQCGFKAFRTPAARLLFHCSVVDRFAFDVGLLVWAKRFGFAVSRTPVRWRRVGGSRVRVVPDFSRMALDVLELRFHEPRPPAINALVLGSGAVRSLDAIVRAVGPSLPVVRDRPPDRLGDEVTVLLPMCDTSTIDTVTADLCSTFPRHPVRSVRLDPLDLVRRGPLALEPWCVPSSRTALLSGAPATPRSTGPVAPTTPPP